MDSLTLVLRAISDPTRRALLDLLRDQELSTAELAAHFKTQRPAISKHLGVLRGAGLVTAQRRGRQQSYVLVDGSLDELYEWIRNRVQSVERAPDVAPKVAPEAAPKVAPKRPPQRSDDSWRSW